jgi:uncharacterized protein (DUF952 family)
MGVLVPDVFQHFPHLYGELPVAAVTETRPYLELTLPAEWAV